MTVVLAAMENAAGALTEQGVGLSGGAKIPEAEYKGRKGKAAS